MLAVILSRRFVAAAPQRAAASACCCASALCSSAAPKPVASCCVAVACTSSGSDGLMGDVFRPTRVLLKMRRRHMPAREPKAGDWTCSCGHTNSKFRRECAKCNGPAPPLPLGEARPKLPGEDPHDWACPCGKMNYRGNVNCHKCGMPKPPPPVADPTAPTMWTCKKCRTINRMSRQFCGGCKGLQKMLAEPIAPTQAP